MNTITCNDVENLLNFSLQEKAQQIVNDFSLQYELLSESEKEQAIVNCIDKLISDLPQAGSHRKNLWENGWNENLQNFISSKEYNDLVPKYFEKQAAIDTIVRWDNNFVKTKTDNFAYKIFALIVDCIVINFISKDFENIYEFGCGTGYNLMRFHKYYENISLYGLDWANSSQDIINFIKNNNIISEIDCSNFDYYNVDKTFKIKENSAVITCCSLEQIGNSFKDVVNYWVDQKPKICINFENDNSIFDDSKLLDKISIEYAKKRNYLDGFYDYLKELESKKIIEIIYVKRLYFGNMFHEGCPVFIWKVL
jgi:hypothetical protein